jgi:hypothetical protein
LDTNFIYTFYESCSFNGNDDSFITSITTFDGSEVLKLIPVTPDFISNENTLVGLVSIPSTSVLVEDVVLLVRDEIVGGVVATSGELIQNPLELFYRLLINS